MKKTFFDINTVGNKFSISEDGSYIFLIDTREQLTVEKDFEIIMTKARIESQIIFKIVAKENSEVLINPLLRISSGQSGTNTYISIKTLMIGQPKKIKIVPSLEIEENDVKAGHGAVVSGIDGHELYYLESKGLTRSNAKQLIIESFIRKN